MMGDTFPLMHARFDYPLEPEEKPWSDDHRYSEGKEWQDHGKS